MANEQKISEIIDDKAFEQIDKLIKELTQAQNDFAKTAKSAVDLGNAVGSSKSFSDFNANIAKASLAQEELNKKRAQTLLAEERLKQAQQRAIEQAEKRLKKEAEVAAKEEARIKRSVEAEKRFADQKASTLDVYDKTIKSVVNETEVRKGLADAEAMEITLEAQKRAAKQATQATVKAVNDEEQRSVDILDKYSGSLREQIGQNIQLKAELKAVQTELKEANKSQVASMATKRELAEQELVLKQALQESNLEIRRTVKEQNAAEGSSVQLSARLDRLRAAYQSLNEEERKNAEVGGVLLTQIKALDKQVKTLDASQGIFNRFVGFYGTWENSLKAIVPGLNELTSAYKANESALKSVTTVLGNYIKGTNAQAAAQGAATKATTGTAVAMRVLRTAIVATGIGALVVVLGSLIAYLTTTQEGIDKIRVVTTFLRTAMQVLLGVAQDIGKWLVKAFTDPKEAIKELGDLLVTNITNRGKGALQILKGIANMDLKMLVDGLYAVGTGIDNITDRTKNFLGNVKDTADEISKLQREIQQGEVDLIVQQARLAKEYKELSEVAEDISANEQDRIKAAKEAIRVTDERLKLEQDLLDKRIAKLKLEQSLNTGTIEDEKELAELEAERYNFETRASEARTTARSKLNAVNKQLAAQAKKEHDEAMARLKKERDAEAELLKFRQKTLADYYQQVAEDSRESFATRIDALENYVKNTEKLYEIERDAALANAELPAQRTKIEEEYNVKMVALRKQLGEQILEVSKDNMDKEDRLRTEIQQRRLNIIGKEQAEELTALSEQYRAGLINREQYERERLNIMSKYARMAIEQEIAGVEELIEANKKKGLDVSEQEKQLAELRLRLSEEVTEKSIENEKKLQETVRSLLKQTADVAIQLVNQRFEAEQMRLEAEMNGVDARAQKEIEDVERTILSQDDKQKRIEQIERKAQLEREKIERKQRETALKQAKFEKATAMLSAGVNTAAAVVKALASFPPPASFILAAATAALGAVQIAAIATKPIPQYYKGTNNSPEGWAWVGEKGAEMRIDPDGTHSLTPDRPTLSYLKKGTQIITAPETKKMLANRNRPEMFDKPNITIPLTSLEKAQEEGNRELRQIRKGMGGGTVITKHGVQYMGKTAQKRRALLNGNGIHR